VYNMPTKRMEKGSAMEMKQSVCLLHRPRLIMLCQKCNRCLHNYFSMVYHLPALLEWEIRTWAVDRLVDLLQEPCLQDLVEGQMVIITQFRLHSRGLTDHYHLHLLDYHHDLRLHKPAMEVHKTFNNPLDLEGRLVMEEIYRPECHLDFNKVHRGASYHQDLCHLLDLLPKLHSSKVRQGMGEDKRNYLSREIYPRMKELNQTSV
jgi:hypothetical protein